MNRHHNQQTATPLLPGSNMPAAGPIPVVRIYRPVRSVTQSAPDRRDWVLEFARSSPYFIEPLMGWTGSTDSFSQIRLNFPDRQSAINFAERHGWSYEVADPPVRRIPQKAYADRFKYELVDALRAPYRGPTVDRDVRRQIDRFVRRDLRARGGEKSGK